MNSPQGTLTSSSSFSSWQFVSSVHPSFPFSHNRLLSAGNGSWLNVKRKNEENETKEINSAQEKDINAHRENNINSSNENNVEKLSKEEEEAIFAQSNIGPVFECGRVQSQKTFWVLAKYVKEELEKITANNYLSPSSSSSSSSSSDLFSNGLFISLSSFVRVCRSYFLAKDATGVKQQLSLFVDNGLLRFILVDKWANSGLILGEEYLLDENNNSKNRKYINNNNKENKELIKGEPSTKESNDKKEDRRSNQTSTGSTPDDYTNNINSEKNKNNNSNSENTLHKLPVDSISMKSTQQSLEEMCEVIVYPANSTQMVNIIYYYVNEMWNEINNTNNNSVSKQKTTIRIPKKKG